MATQLGLRRFSICPLSSGWCRPQHMNRQCRRISPLTQQLRLQSTSDSLPRLAQASVWSMIIPKFIRNRWSARKSPGVAKKNKEWNPASFYIVIFILIGSQAIRMIGLKNDYAGYTRSTDAKIRLLKEVIEKIQRGEKVDVEKMLGTGDEAKEREWGEVLREIEEEDSLWHQKASQADHKDQPPSPAPTESPDTSKSSTVDDEPPKAKRPLRKAGFF
ncbi:hypothetical protein ASPZODRAFT_134316 [Penicilliopsis zonata CBS 506.65]|uniref:Uncharacterized protein n=1 Tax=Penicilliopsis zonata CBS 506.65 TaxID=1073090 RepID=A0A1L9SCF9_9EURO|nr:hypothetical protein ASPZODRAFT_134316 [Penicilliopsis zonata CBS 506.65]OJJ44900.1 hypothetical protein ASPZODRAFT_134316 [Penicilliopsis zonata CBS 506.65]